VYSVYQRVPIYGTMCAKSANAFRCAQAFITEGFPCTHLKRVSVLKSAGFPLPPPEPFLAFGA